MCTTTVSANMKYNFDSEKEFGKGGMENWRGEGGGKDWGGLGKEVISRNG